jgi:hypothetical protein
MSRRNKKRTKRYSGEDAKQTAGTETVVHRYEAVNRSAAGEWWQRKKRSVKIIAIAAGIVVLLIATVGELIHLL